MYAIRTALTKAHYNRIIQSSINKLVKGMKFSSEKQKKSRWATIDVAQQQNPDLTEYTMPWKHVCYRRGKCIPAGNLIKHLPTCHGKGLNKCFNTILHLWYNKGQTMDHKYTVPLIQSPTNIRWNPVHIERLRSCWGAFGESARKGRHSTIGVCERCRIFELTQNL